MATSLSQTTKSQNQLLARLPDVDYQRLAPRLQTVSLPVKQIVYKARAPIDYVYFPLSGIVSAMTIMRDGSAIEVATIGNEGLVGVMAFVGIDESANELMVQVAGDAVRTSAEVFRAEASHEGALRRLLTLYHAAFYAQVSYGVACNGLHTIEKRCCRWLLMTRDRLGSSVLPLTHEFLGIMLGVRRSSITEVLQPLQELGLIRYKRGEITIIDGAGLEAKVCECYHCINDEFARLLK